MFARYYHLHTFTFESINVKHNCFCLKNSKNSKIRNIFSHKHTFLYISIFTFGFLILISLFMVKNNSAQIPYSFSKNQQIAFNDGTDKSDITQTLFNAVKILCLINSSKKQIQDRAIHINATWAKRCNKYYFLTFEENINLPFLDLKVNETRHDLWNKIRAAFKWIYENEIDNFDYFLRADDDSFYIMENLRFMLLAYNKNDPLYIGARFKFGVPNGYMSGGSGVILTKAAINRLVPNFGNASICPQATSDNDDLELGICVQNLNIISVDTRDFQGRHRMFPWGPSDHLLKGLEQRHLDYLYYPYKQNKTFDCCAEHMISFHYVYGEMLYMIEFLIYHAKLIGIVDHSWVKTITAPEENGKLSVLEQLKIASKNVNFNRFQGI